MRPLFKIGCRRRTKPYTMIFLLLLFWEGQFFFHDWLPSTYIVQPTATLQSSTLQNWNVNNEVTLYSSVRPWSVRHFAQTNVVLHVWVDVVNAIGRLMNMNPCVHVANVYIFIFTMKREKSPMHITTRHIFFPLRIFFRQIFQSAE